MKLLLIDPSDVNPYGIDLGNGLHDAGLDVRLLAPVGFACGGRARCQVIESSPRRCHGGFVRKVLQEASHLGRTARLLSAWHPDVIHIQWLRIGAEVAFLPLLRQMGYTLVVTAHNPLPHERRSGDVRFYRQFYGIADRVIVHDSGTRKALEDVLGVRSAQIDTIPPGIEDVAPEQRMAKRVARSELGVPDEEPLFLFFGGLRPYKGYEDLLEAFEAAIDSGLHGRLIIAGWGRSSVIAALTERIGGCQPRARERIGVRIEVDAPLPQRIVDLLFNACDCVVLPYRDSSHSGVLFQAFAYNRAVLASHNGYFGDIITDGRTGFLVAVGAVPQLAASLLRLSVERPLLEEIGRGAGEWARRTFSWAAAAESTISTYQKAMDGR